MHFPRAFAHNCWCQVEIRRYQVDYVTAMSDSEDTIAKIDWRQTLNAGSFGDSGLEFSSIDHISTKGEAIGKSKFQMILHQRVIWSATEKHLYARYYIGCGHPASGLNLLSRR